MSVYRITPRTGKAWTMRTDTLTSELRLALVRRRITCPISIRLIITGREPQ